MGGTPIGYLVIGDHHDKQALERMKEISEKTKEHIDSKCGKRSNSPGMLAWCRKCSACVHYMVAHRIISSRWYAP